MTRKASNENSVRNKQRKQEEKYVSFECALGMGRHQSERGSSRGFLSKLAQLSVNLWLTGGSLRAFGQYIHHL